MSLKVRRLLVFSAAAFLLLPVVVNVLTTPPETELDRIAERSAKQLCILRIKFDGQDDPGTKEACDGLYLDAIDRQNAGLD